ncbi:hypothetical protein H7X69_02765 [Candidatus Saccharibacteria bacterium]|nr:hypothetical protein [Candidatus Saccharibacteria bacterium]
MEKKIIESVATSLPPSKFGEHEIWEETDGGAYFIASRHTLPTTNGLEVLAISVSGEPSERARVVAEFCEVFGPPARLDILLEHVDHVDVVAWLVQ